MAGIEAQLEAIRSRLRQLLSTHLNQLQPITRSYAAGEIVIEQGEAAERVFLVSSGVLAVEHLEAEHPARVLALVRSNTPSTRTLIDNLSPQEKRVLALIADGLTNKEVAQEMNLAEKTVKNYLSTVFEKLHVTRRTQAAALYAQTQKGR